MSALIDYEKYPTFIAALGVTLDGSEMIEEREATFSEKQAFAVVVLRALADGIEEGKTIIEGFEVNRDTLNTGVHKYSDDHYCKTFVAGPLRVPAFTIYHVQETVK